MEKMLLNIIIEEEKAIKELLNLLDKQFQKMAEEDVFALDAIVDEIKICNKNIAEFEVKRRNLLNGTSMKEFVEKSNDRELEEAYRSIKKLLELVVRQKDTNDVLLKQKLVLTNQFLRIANPSRDAKIYNSYGKVKR